MKRITRIVSTAAVMAAAVMAAGAIGGCTSPVEGYCDENTPCPQGQVCAPDASNCVPVHDAGVDGRPADAGVEAAAPDGGDARADQGRDLPGDATPDSKLPNGASCASKDPCASGHCVDGVCCDGPCSDLCRSCAASGSQGTCTLVPKGQDPDLECAGTSAGCGGSCDGQGACALPGPTTSCGQPSCAGGSLTSHSCDGKGTCDPLTTSCGGYACATSKSCRASCSQASHCTGTYQCVGGACVNQLPNGTICGTNPKACKSGLCVDGVCCASACTGVCTACNLAGKLGICSPKKDGTTCAVTTCAAAVKTIRSCSKGACSSTKASCGLYQCSGNACRTACSLPAHCTASAYCGATTCKAKKANGVGCATGVECTSGTCASGVCCNKACGGACESCALAGKKGTCTPRPAGTSCGAADKCANATSSSYIVQNACNGVKSTCVSSNKSCGDYRCSGSTNACLTSCTTHGQCTTGLCDLFDTHGRKNTCPAASDVCRADASKACPGAGTAGAPFCSIQDCLNQKPKYVAVADGTYNENLTAMAHVELVSTGTTGPLLKYGLPQAGVAKVIVKGTKAGTEVLEISGAIKAAVFGLNISQGTGGSGDLVRVETTGQAVVLQTCDIHNTSARGIYTIGPGAATQPVLLRDVAVAWTAVGVEAVMTDLTLQGVGIGTSTQKAMEHSGGKLTARDVLIAWNTGVGLQTYGSVLDFDRVHIRSNSNGGLSMENNSSGLLVNVLVNDNGKGVYTSFNTATIHMINATVANNGGYEVECDAPLQLTNSIVWDKTSTSLAWSGQCNFDYSDVQSPFTFIPGTHNIDADPKFDSSNPNARYTLLVSSPCVDRGNDAVTGVTLPAKDFIGNPRKVDKLTTVSGVIDMGAYEVQ